MAAAFDPANPEKYLAEKTGASAPLPLQPGVQAIGTEGPAPAFDPAHPEKYLSEKTGIAEEPKGVVQKAVSTIGGGVGAVGKAFDVLRGTTTAPLLAGALQMATGKDVFRPGEMVDAVNPTNLKKFPSANELYARAGVPEGGHLSDVAKSPLSALPFKLTQALSQIPALQYAQHTGSNPWYQPEKGGMLDPSIRGAGGLATDIAIDPATWLSLGAAGLKRAAGAADASTEVLSKLNQGPISKALSPVTGPAQDFLDMATKPVESATQAIASNPIGNAAVNLSTAPSKALAAMGKKFYNGFLMPVENEGAKYSKADVGDTIYKAGIKTPFGLDKKAGTATQALMDARNSILDKAGTSGATTSMSESMQPIAQKISEIRATGDPQTQPIADAMEAKMNEYLNLEKGTPAVPATSAQVPNGLLDAQGNPMLSTQVTPGKAAIPGKVITPELSSGYKTSLYNSLPAGTFNDAVQTPLGGQLRATIARGLKNQTENSVAKTLGPDAGLAVSNLNDDAGKLLSTRRAQLRVSNQADRISSDLGNITGTDAALAPIAVMKGADMSEGLTALAVRKAMQAARLGAMPTGYGLRRAAEGEMTGPALDIFLRQKAIQKANDNQGERQ